jgi:diguanylate cyclase (GGDEF)-like protein/PAS domain S-box-containing protein
MTEQVLDSPRTPVTAPPRVWRIGSVLIGLSLLLLLPLLAFLLMWLEGEARRISVRTESAAMSLAQISAHSLERQLGDTQQFLATLAGRDSVRALDITRCDPVFGDFQKSHPGFTSLTTTTLDGRLVCSSMGEAVNRPRLMTPLTVGQAVGAPYFQLGQAQKGFLTGKWVLPVSLALLDDAGNTRGAIAAWIHLARLSPLNDSTLSRMPKDTISTVFDDKGVVLARSKDAELWVGVNRTGFPQATQALKQRLGYFQATSQTDGIRRLFAVTPVEGTRWIVSVGIPTSAMDDELAQARQRGFALFGAALLFTVLVLWLVRRYAVHPVQIGAEVTQAARGGDLKRRIPMAAIGPIAELRSIASDFNAMLDTLEADRGKLAASEADFRTLFNEMRSGFAVHDIICDAAGSPVDYRFVAVNPAFEDMTGLHARDIIGKRVTELLSNVEPSWIERYGRVALTGEPAAFEDFSAALNKYFDVRAFCIRHGQFAVMTLDITERRLAQVALAREKALLRRVIDTIPDLIFFKDAGGHYLGCNTAFEAFAGRPESQQIGRTDFDFFDMDTAEFFRAQDRQMLESGEMRRNDEWVSYPDGRQVLLHTVKVPFANAQGEVIGVLGISRDITTAHQAQVALKAQDDTYRAILATSLDGFWIVDTDGRLIEANAAYTRMSGYSRQELLGMHVSELDAQDTPEMVAQRMKHMVSSGGDIFESRHRRKDGSLWAVEVNVNYWPDQDRQFVFVRDVYQRKRAETLAKTRLKLSELALHSNLDGLMQGILDAAELASDSCIGFFHFVDADQENLTLQAWSSHTLQHMCKADGKGQHYPISQAGVWVDCVAQRKPVVHNDYAALAHKKGLPPGHAPIVRELTVPVIRHNLVVAILGVGNKLQPYTDDDVDLVAEFAGMAMDLVDSKRADEQLRQAAAVFENTQEGMMMTDANDIIVRVNPAFTRLTGYSPEDALGQKPSLLTSPLQDESLFKSMRRSLAQRGQWQGEIINRRKNGEDFPQWMTISSILDTGGQLGHYVSTFTDISLLKEAQAKVHSLAFFDPLTQLPNRSLMLDRLQRAVASSVRRKGYGAVLLIDLDNFKLLNDTQGHEVGDQLLVQVAHRLKTCIREQDSLAHQGGDEFIVILEDLGGDLHEAAGKAELVAEKILDALRERYQLGLVEHHSQASIGVATYHDQSDRAEEIVKRAETAMYRAKDEGRNTTRFFDPAMQAALEQRLQMEAELRHALPAAELQLYYQAQVDSDGVVVSAEALIRWLHPRRGLVSPMQFIPLAEESGLILPIGVWVLETACAQIKAWEKDATTRNLKLAVNVSARQFRQDDFVAVVRGIVESSGIDPSRLKLELTESVVVNNVADTIEKMHQLKVLGLSFSMDDFGTGYSSLAYLKRLPLDQLKIDQSFVRDISQDPSDAAIVQTIITMGNTLGLNVIAEGVETQVQLDFLKKYGCRTYQGYLFSRPVPLAEFEALVARQVGQLAK